MEIGQKTDRDEKETCPLIVATLALQFRDSSVPIRQIPDIFVERTGVGAGRTQLITRWNLS